MKALKLNDKVISPDGIPGVVVEASPDWGEYLVALDTGQRIYYYGEELALDGPHEAQDELSGDK